MPNTETRLRALQSWFSQLPGALVAFSGGVDSALALFLARRYLGRDRAIACIADSPSLKRADLLEAKSFCQRFDIQLEILTPGEIDDPAYHANPVNRCFACKSHLYQDLERLRPKYPTFAALNGTNADDFGDYRPGLQAASDHRVLSPLADCGLDKQAVRALARRFDLPNWDKPASPCLSSRIPYGQPVTRQKLGQIEAAESVLLRYGFRDARVRHFGDQARIEVPPADLPALKPHLPRIAAALRGLGFAEIVLDEEGLVSGKLNRAIRANA